MSEPPFDPAPATELIERGDFAAAAAMLRQALWRAPSDPDVWGLYGVAMAMAGQIASAETALQRAAALAPQDPQPLMNLVRIRLAANRYTAAAEAADALVRLTPDDPEAHRLAAQARDRDGAEARVAAAMRALADPGAGSGPAGPREGAALEAAYDAVLDAAEVGAPLGDAGVTVLLRLGAHERLAALEAQGLGAPESLPLIYMRLARTGPGLEARRALIAEQPPWAEEMEAAAARDPVVTRPRARSGGEGGRLRIGFLSNDLRRTNVGGFAWPLFEHADHDRFELYAYSRFGGGADPVQTVMAGWTQAFRHHPGASAREMAQAIADDGLDLLVELGDPSSWAVVAHKPAPLIASWLGYPNSAGLSAVDNILVDRFLRPSDPRLLLEAPLLMRSWKTMSPAYFEAEPRPKPEPPSAVRGFITFGSLNATYKYSPACLDAWAAVLTAVPDSRLLIVRPEAGAPTFRRNFGEALLRRGVSPRRIIYEPVRGAHLPWYSHIDVALDTAPVTGGTTTCESLWMGVPTVSLVGEAMFERASYSILENAGLGAWAAHSLDEYVGVAAALAEDEAERARLRAGLRDQIRAHPLGQAEAFARDFYDLAAARIAAG